MLYFSNKCLIEVRQRFIISWVKSSCKCGPRVIPARAQVSMAYPTKHAAIEVMWSHNAEQKEPLNPLARVLASEPTTDLKFTKNSVKALAGTNLSWMRSSQTNVTVVLFFLQTIRDHLRWFVDSVSCPLHPLGCVSLCRVDHLIRLSQGLFSQALEYNIIVHQLIINICKRCSFRLRLYLSHTFKVVYLQCFAHAALPHQICRCSNAIFASLFLVRWPWSLHGC